MTLQEVRKSKGLSQSQLANLSGVSVRNIQHYEREYRDINTAKLETICKIAAALKCRVSDILSDEELLTLYKKVK